MRTEKGRTAREIADSSKVKEYLTAVSHLRGCFTILSAVVVERTSGKSPLKLLKVDLVKMLRDFLVDMTLDDRDSYKT